MSCARSWLVRGWFIAALATAACSAGTDQSGGPAVNPGVLTPAATARQGEAVTEGQAGVLLTIEPIEPAQESVALRQSGSGDGSLRLPQPLIRLNIYVLCTQGRVTVHADGPGSDHDLDAVVRCRIPERIQVAFSQPGIETLEVDAVDEVDWRVLVTAPPPP